MACVLEFKECKPDSFEDYESYLASVKKNGSQLKKVPEKFLTEELCITAINSSYSGNVIQDIKEENRTYNMYVAAINKDGINLCYVPKNLRSLELCLLAHSKNPRCILNIPCEFIRYIPDAKDYSIGNLFF